MKLLELHEVTRRFGGLVANDKISFDMSKGEILGIVGPNGAGKTTLFNCISGFYRVNSGQILFEDGELTNRPPYAICAKGVARTFQIVQNFDKMSLIENIMVGAFLRHKRKGKTSEEGLQVLKFIDLFDKKDVEAGHLSPPEKRRLGLGMALATQPKLLLLDEAMAGLTPVEIDEVLNLVRKIRNTGVAVIIIEHVMRAVMTISDRIIVLDSGKKIAEGTPDKIAHNERVIRAYLGKSYAQS
jgi:branched-chain amino acid transport system ATP-binding protein